MAFTPYVTLPEFKAWVKLDDTVDDAVMAPVVESVSRWIDEFCDRHFWQDGTVASPVARTFCASQWWRLDIDDLTSAVAPVVKTDAAGDGTFETTWAASDYQLQPVNRPTGRPYTRIESISGLQFPIKYWGASGRDDRVQITGVWGWSAVPADVKQACLIQSSRVLHRRSSPHGVAGLSEFGIIRVGSRLDPDVQQMLDPFRRTAVLVA